MSLFNGIPVVENRNMPAPWTWEQVRFPRTKKRRIRKKWSKRQANWGQVPRAPEFYRVAATEFFGEQIMGHPDAIAMLRAAADSGGSR